jgi:phage-related protein (TIGR01555 family)
MDKPRVRVQAGTTRFSTADSFQNFISRVGIGTGSQVDGSTYGFNPVSRDWTKLEFAYRGSWIVRQVVDARAEDMTQAGIEIQSEIPPEDIEELVCAFDDLAIWKKLCSAIKWARLYGGAIAVILIDGQKLETPLRVETITKDQFKGLAVLDRRMINPNQSEYVTELGPNLGMPIDYMVTTPGAAIPVGRVHHTRVIRFEGEDLPFFQKLYEQGWGLSVIEPLWDRLIAFDSTTQGAAQLVYKAHLRTINVENLRETIAMGGQAYEGLIKQFDMIRFMQTNEGITLLDSKDTFSVSQYSFSGLDLLLIQFAQQLSGAAKTPLTRLFGQSPAGLNATGDSDLRNYYDSVKADQESSLKHEIKKLLDIMHRSVLGREPSGKLNFIFRSLWQMDESERAEIADKTTRSILAANEAAVIDHATTLKELRQASRDTGIFTNITDEMITDAENEPPLPELPAVPAPGELPGVKPKEVEAA